MMESRPVPSVDQDSLCRVDAVFVVSAHFMLIYASLIQFYAEFMLNYLGFMQCLCSV